MDVPFYPQEISLFLFVAKMIPRLSFLIFYFFIINLHLTSSSLNFPGNQDAVQLPDMLSFNCTSLTNTNEIFSKVGIIQYIY